MSQQPGVNLPPSYGGCLQQGLINGRYPLQTPLHHLLHSASKNGRRQCCRANLIQPPRLLSKRSHHFHHEKGVALAFALHQFNQVGQTAVFPQHRLAQIGNVRCGQP